MSTDDFEYAGFWIRVWASLIDTVCVLLLTAPLLSLFTDVDGLLGTSVGLRWPEFLITWVLPAAAVLVFWRTRQATPGKMAIGAVIVDANTGGAPTSGQLVGRYAGYFVAAVPVCLGLVWVGLDRRKQGWHDKLAGTVVIRRKGGTAAVEFPAVRR